jgi:hypothetical protein
MPFITILKILRSMKFKPSMPLKSIRRDQSWRKSCGVMSKRFRRAIVGRGKERGIS